MRSPVEFTDSYKNTRKWVMLISWFGIFWASSTLNITKVSIPYIKDINITGNSIPLVILILLIFSVVKMHNEYAMMSIRTRRNSLAIFDFRLFLYLSKLAILSLAVSVEIRSIKQIMIFLGAFVPIAILIAISGTLIGFLIVAIGSRFRKAKSGFAFWVIAMFSLGTAIAQLMIIISIIGIAFGLTFSDSIRNYFEISPTTIGIWTVSLVTVLLMLQQHFEGIYSPILFGREVYNPRTNTKKYYDSDGSLTQVIGNYDPSKSKANTIHIKKV